MRFCKKSCYARLFDLLRNSPLSSIHIHFGVELLVLAALLTSVSLSITEFFEKFILFPCISVVSNDIYTLT